MSFEKFKSLLEERAIYFSNFKRFEDHLEGRYPFGNWKHFYNVLKQKRKYNTENPDSPESISELVNLVEGHFYDDLGGKDYPYGNRKLIDNIYMQNRNHDKDLILDLIWLMEAHVSNQYLIGGNFINCWHQNEYESVDMWKQYSQNGKGICIASNIKRLKECFAEDEAHEVKIGTVNYIDYSTDYLPPDNMYHIFTHKDKKKFEHENEVRAYVLMKGEEYWDQKGILVPVSLDTLIERIYVSPMADDLFFDSVKSLTEEYGIKKEVTHSNLK